MFGKQKQQNSTIIGRGARFSGTLELEGAVHIEGACEGVIRAQGPLSVGPHGSMVGDLIASFVAVAGRVEGTVVAHEVLHVLRSGGVKGEVYYGRLQVDPGGTIAGRSFQGAPPEVATAPAALPPASELEDAELEETRDEESGVKSLFPNAGREAPNAVNQR